MYSNFSEPFQGSIAVTILQDYGIAEEEPLQKVRVQWVFRVNEAIAKSIGIQIGTHSHFCRGVNMG
jgi:hypothetical protein